MPEDSSGAASVDPQTHLRPYLKDVPGLGLLVTALYFVLKDTIADLAPLKDVSGLTQTWLLWLVALALGGIGYGLGNFWDNLVFDPLYSVDLRAKKQGRWATSRSRRVFGLLPAGEPLANARNRAVRVCLGPTSSGEGIYRAARQKALATGQWVAAEGLLVLSKLFRAFIWPSLFIAARFAYEVIILELAASQLDLQSLLYSLVALLITGGLFVPYLQFRVDHMTTLYELAAGPPTPSEG